MLHTPSLPLSELTSILGRNSKRTNLHLLSPDTSSALFFGSAEQTPHDLASDLLCRYSPKGRLLEQVRMYGAPNDMT